MWGQMTRLKMQNSERCPRRGDYRIKIGILELQLDTHCSSTRKVRLLRPPFF